LSGAWSQAPVDWKRGVKLFGDDETTQSMRRALEDQGIVLHSWRPFSLQPTVETVEIGQTFSITKEMKRGIAKIAFNYLAFRQGGEFVRSESFDPIRRYIRNGIDLDLEPIHSSFELPFRTRQPDGVRPIVHWVELATHESHRNLLCTVMLLGFMKHAVVLAENYRGPWNHDVLIQSEYVPDDLLTEYLDRSRPWFMAGKPAESGEEPETQARVRKGAVEKRPPAKPHDWLLVSTSGRGYGCPEEKTDGTGRNKRAFKNRCAQAGLRFKVAMSAVALSAGKLLPGTRYEFGPHSVRGSCGYGVFLIHGDAGVQMAAHYLGDEEDTVREAYSSINGVHVDSSCLVGIVMVPQLDTDRRRMGKAVSARATDLYRLVDALEDGAIDTAAFLAEMSAVANGRAASTLRVA
jgi:hypothetical protein